jgi:hypothetical protein
MDSSLLSVSSLSIFLSVLAWWTASWSQCLWTCRSRSPPLLILLLLIRLSSGASPGPPVPGIHPPRHRLCHLVDLSSYALSLGASPHHNKAHLALSTRLPRLWPTPTSVYLLLQVDGLHGCGLGGLLEYTLVYLELCCVPQRQPHLLVLQAPEHCLPIERRD